MNLPGASRLCLLLPVVLGCGSPPVVVIHDWTLQIEGQSVSRKVRIPNELGPLLPTSPSQFSLRTEVDLPPELRGQALTLAFADLPVVATLLVDGQEVPEIEDRMGRRVLGAGLQRWRLLPPLTNGHALALELRIWRGQRTIGSFDTPARLSATRSGDPTVLWIGLLNRWSATAALSTALFVGFVNLIIFLLDRRRKSHGWFALGAFSASFYPIVMLGLAQLVLCFHYAPVLVFAIWLAEVAFVHFVHAQFDLAPPSRAWILVLPVLAAMLIVRPFSGIFAPATAAFTCLTVGYQLWKLLPLTRQRPKPMNVWTLVICWTTIGLTAWPDLLSWSGHGFGLGGLRSGCVGLTVLLVLQSSSLSRAHAQSLLRVRELNCELAHRITMLENQQREICVLNEELRRQVRERSHELAAALLRVQTGPVRAPPLQPGDLIDNRFRVVGLIGSGGMGAVYEVERLSDGRRLALKAIKAKAAAQQVARLAHEAEITAHIDHPNVVSMVGVEVSNRGHLYLIMELVRGSTLEQEQPRYGELEFMIPILRQVALGVQAIHDQGVVHRDLKPSNVLLTPGRAPIAKIADFGISKLRPVLEASADPQEVLDATAEIAPSASAASEREPRLTRTGVIMGTRPYMAPELLAGATAATPRSDMYSLGLIAYEALCGAYPIFEPTFPDGSGPARAIPLARACPALPPELAMLVDRCLSLDPQGRPPAAELAEALGRTRSQKQSVM